MRIQLKEWVVPSAIGLASLSAGFGLGYLFARKKTEKERSETAERIEELESEQLQLDFKHAEMTREFDIQIQQAINVIKELKQEGRSHLDKLAADLHKSVLGRPAAEVLAEMNKTAKKHPSNKESQKIEVIPNSSTEEDNIVINVFPDEDDNWDYDEELKNRSPNHPYIIHRDEYFSNEMEFRQSTLTFYMGDEILCDDDDTPVYNPEQIVGKLIFGHGSRDISICYVRNEKLMAEYEVLVDHGYYQQEVLGAQAPLKTDIKHSRRVTKFKRE